jgi:hypothetical protein
VVELGAGHRFEDGEGFSIAPGTLVQSLTRKGIEHIRNRDDQKPEIAQEDFLPKVSQLLERALFTQQGQSGGSLGGFDPA